MNIITYISTLGVLAVLDTAWLLSMGGLYKKWLGHLFSSTVNFVPAVIFYLLYAFGVVFFVISPALKSGQSSLAVFATGALLGLLAYATYDLTNHATLRNWPLQVTIIDMIWGALLTGIVAVAVVWITNYFR